MIMSLRMAARAACTVAIPRAKCGSWDVESSGTHGSTDPPQCIASNSYVIIVVRTEVPLGSATAPCPGRAGSGRAQWPALGSAPGQSIK